MVNDSFESFAMRGYFDAGYVTQLNNFERACGAFLDPCLCKSKGIARGRHVLNHTSVLGYFREKRVIAIAEQVLKHRLRVVLAYTGQRCMFVRVSC